MINDIDDLLISKPSEDNKLIHKWEQSTAEATYIIKNLSVEHQLVVDPFLGYGSTGGGSSEDYYTTAADRIRRTRSTVCY